MFTLEPEESEGDQGEPSLKEHFSEGQLKIQAYLTDILDDYRSNFDDISELEYLCQVIKVNS
jgi:hypothetical protein